PLEECLVQAVLVHGYRQSTSDAQVHQGRAGQEVWPKLEVRSTPEVGLHEDCSALRTPFPLKRQRLFEPNRVVGRELHLTGEHVGEHGVWIADKKHLQATDLRRPEHVARESAGLDKRAGLPAVEV